MKKIPHQGFHGAKNWDENTFLGEKEGTWADNKIGYARPYHEVLETIKKPDGTSEERKTISSKIESEPSFIKLYLDDITYLCDIPKSASDVIFELLKLVDYEQNLYIHKDQKTAICNRLNLKENAVNKAISALNNAQIILRVSRGHYILNPFFFGKGSWKDIRQIRLELLYNPEKLGIKSIKINPDDIEEEEGRTGT